MPRLKNQQCRAAQSRVTSANHCLPSHTIQKGSWRTISVRRRKCARIRKFVSGAQSAIFAFPPVFCWKAAGKYQGGRAQEVVLRGGHFGEWLKFKRGSR